MSFECLFKKFLFHLIRSGILNVVLQIFSVIHCIFTTTTAAISVDGVEVTFHCGFASARSYSSFVLLLNKFRFVLSHVVYYPSGMAVDHAVNLDSRWKCHATMVEITTNSRFSPEKLDKTRLFSLFQFN